MCWVRTLLAGVTAAVVALSGLSAAELSDPVCSITFDESTDSAAICSAASSCVNIHVDTTQISATAMEAKLPTFSGCLANVSSVTGDFMFGAGSMPLLEKVEVVSEMFVCSFLFFSFVQP